MTYWYFAELLALVPICYYYMSSHSALQLITVGTNKVSKVVLLGILSSLTIDANLVSVHDTSSHYYLQNTQQDWTDQFEINNGSKKESYHFKLFSFALSYIRHIP